MAYTLGIVRASGDQRGRLRPADATANWSNSWSNSLWHDILRSCLPPRGASEMERCHRCRAPAGSDGSILTGGWPIPASSRSDPGSPMPPRWWNGMTHRPHQPVPARRPVLALRPARHQRPGSLWANLWDTNSSRISSPPLPMRSPTAVWQHVALTYDTNSANAVLYTNGQPAATVQFPTNFVPRTSGDLYLGFHPPGPPIASVSRAAWMNSASISAPSPPARSTPSTTPAAAANTAPTCWSAPWRPR